MKMPPRIAKLPRHRIMGQDYPVPWFIARVEGREPDFRIADNDKRQIAVKHSKCWVCGELLGKFKAYVIGPMCSITRTTSEPGCHLDCAEWSACNCPFLTRPRMRRNEKDLPEDGAPPAGVAIMRNPGVACVWTSLFAARPFRVPGGYLLKLQEPTSVKWFAEGREATREEVLRSINGGFPALREMAAAEGPDAMVELMQQSASVEKFYPAAA